MKKIIIDEGKIGKRIDKFLKKEIFSNGKITRGEIIRAIKSGDILVNNNKVKPSYLLKERDSLIISNFKFQISNGVAPNQNLKIKIIEDNKNFLVIDKPAGIQVHPDAHEKRNTVANWLIAKYPKIKKVHDQSRDAELRPGIVHRLDKETSGIMVIAKNQKTLNALKKLFQTRKVKKTYWAIVFGKMENKKGVIEKALAKASNYKKQVVASSRTKTKMRPAVTEYKLLKEIDNFSLLEVYPRTGRTHQIRVHLWSIGHPVLGDNLYKLKLKSLKQKAIEGGRQLLHAREIEFVLFGEKYHFSAKLPADFNQLIKA